MWILEIIKELVLWSGSLYIWKKKKKNRGAPIKQNKTGWVFGGCSTSQLISIRQCDKQRRILSATPETGNLRRDHQLIIRTFVWCRSVPRVEHRRVTKPTAECQKLCRYKQKTKKKTPEKSFLPLKLYDKIHRDCIVSILANEHLTASDHENPAGHLSTDAHSLEFS